MWLILKLALATTIIIMVLLASVIHAATYHVSITAPFVRNTQNGTPLGRAGLKRGGAGQVPGVPTRKWR